MQWMTMNEYLIMIRLMLPFWAFFHSSYLISDFNYTKSYP